MRSSVVAGMTLAVLALAGPLHAQRPYVQAPFAVADDTILAVAVRSPLDTAWLGASLLTPIPDVQEPIIQAQDATLPEAFRGDTTLPCLEFECAEPGTRKKRFFRSLGEVVIVNIIPNAFSRLQDKEWSKWTLQSWADNIKYPWQWDNNAFLNNQFSHPYHGSLYFNAGRSNGYNFWQSVPWAFGGSLMWELFFEVWAPAPNDLLNTALGGIALGEMLYRVSSLTLDNEATGTERVFREIGATLLNPVRGFNRAVDGTMFKRSRTPDEWRPSTIFANVELGYRRFSTNEDITDPNALETGYVGASLVYGAAISDVTKAPFSHFRLNSLISFQPGEGARRLSELTVRGSLGGMVLGDPAALSRLAAFMTYEYISNPIMEFGAQGFQGGWLHSTQPTSGPRLYFDAAAVFNPIAAVKSDYFLSEEGRDYDYGIGLGGRGEMRAIWTGRAFVGAVANYRFVPVISGFPAQHQLLNLGVDGRYYFRGRWGVGAAYNQLWRWSAYTDRADFNKKSSELRVFVATAIPRWEDIK
jgi:hypothetical protein